MLIAPTLLRLFRALRRTRRPAPDRADSHDVLECPLCRARFSCPMDWGTVDDDHWWVLSRCGECGVWSEACITNAQAADLDGRLNHQQGLIRRAADCLAAERMATDVEVFIGALQHDLIDASDFA